MTDTYQQAYRRCKHGHPSSYRMQDSALVFGELRLKAGDTFLDIGCGVGDYALHAARLVGDTGHVYALDTSPGLIAELKALADTAGITNITACVADATKPLPLQNDSVDVCLAATVLHTPNMAMNADRLLSEIRRVLRPTGWMAIIECSKKDLSCGPPESIRLSPEATHAMLAQSGFREMNHADLGFNYMITAKPSLPV